MPRSITALTLTAIAACLIGCGGSSDDPTVAAIPGGADPAEVEVIDEWAHTLSGATSTAPPPTSRSRASLRTARRVRIRDLADAKLFNASLPCGASLVEATTDGEFTIATFRLTERPGPGVCDAAAEAEAQTAFKIEDGKITEWRRVLSDGDGGEQASEQLGLADGLPVAAADPDRNGGLRVASDPACFPREECSCQGSS